ncbi:MAG: putative Ig domain-containing protein [Fimbriimonadaceae bacterium]|nr:putative Ig domain-containing protein [Fimbriimonadaceae bacterium]
MNHTLLPRRSLSLVASILVAGASHAQSWHVRPISEPPASQVNPVMQWVKEYETAEVSYSELRAALRNAPKQLFGLSEQPGVELLLPTPTGIQRFHVWENDLLSPRVQATVPGLRTFSGQGIDDPSASVRFEFGYGSFRAMIMGTDGYTFIEPMKFKNDGTYFFYDRKNSMRQPGWFCKTEDKGNTLPFFDTQQGSTGFEGQRNTGTNLWTFRLALNCTAEYYTAAGGTTTAAVSRMTTSANRVDGVYEKEMAISLNLVLAKVFTNPATFANNNGGTMLGQNQTQCDLDPGNANYDIGHVFSTGGGGIAGLGVVGITGNKARGVTGSPSPVGDSFDIDYVAHEMGHQFGGDHSFNGVTGSCGGGNRNRATAWEPGSGSTIMAYAGICGSEDVQPHSDPYFHVGNIIEILPYRVAARGGVSSATTNIVPVVNAGSDYTIPPNTPFKLTMSATDGNSDPLVFQWDELDVPASGTANQGSTTATTTNTSRPLFRSYNPTTNPTRYFPSQGLVLANNFTHQHEFVPNVARTMIFRAVARDNRTTGGGTAWDSAVITVSGTSTFAVSSPNTNITWNRNNLFNVTWNTANTTAAPFNTSQVRIYLSTNSGGSYFTNPPTATLLATTANDGSETVSMPLNTPGGSTARIFVEAVGNAFFDVSNVNFTISTTNATPTLAAIANQTINEMSLWTYSMVGSDTDTAQSLAYSLVSGPTGMSVNAGSGQISWTPTEAQGPGSYPVTVRVSDNNQPTPAVADRSFTINVLEVGSTVTGTVNFNSYIPSEVGKQVLVQVGPNGNSSILESGTVTLGSGNSLSYVSNLPNGTYRVYVTRNYYLRRRISNVVLTSGSSVNAGTFNLICGDADNSGEIDAADIDVVISNFGNFTDPGDIDGSGEVDATDIDLVIANFGSVGD